MLVPSCCGHGTARHGTARYGTARHGAARHGMAQAAARSCLPPGDLPAAVPCQPQSAHARRMRRWQVSLYYEINSRINLVQKHVAKNIGRGGRRGLHSPHPARGRGSRHGMADGPGAAKRSGGAGARLCELETPSTDGAGPGPPVRAGHPLGGKLHESLRSRQAPSSLVRGSAGCAGSMPGAP